MRESADDNNKYSIKLNKKVFQLKFEIKNEQNNCKNVKPKNNCYNKLMNNNKYYFALLRLAYTLSAKTDSFRHGKKKIERRIMSKQFHIVE